ncbi:MAG TPA: cell envelope integrity protein CreD [Hypericibacter adhaerens]|uniref:cell envelope integrity protein CreD n=1 Tax=Hypericibacter adhaerens TaxID=2602016 RepID=UPI002CBCE509|nr:cell envelope integrity protein CreD [Hypericibacter adhaerens]HWA44752.1 cell envelope integrity protein CreD [Hypericibacter adhaerens]
MTDTAPRLPGLSGWLGRLAFNLHIAGIVAIALLLLIPLSMVRDLINERSYRQQEVQSGIAAEWGGAQTLVGPILKVPYRVKPAPNQPERLSAAFYLPQTLDATLSFTHEMRYRAVFEVPVYRAHGTLAGSFPPAASLPVPADATAMLWDQAVLLMGVGDLAGIDSDPSLTWRGQPAAFAPGSSAPAIPGMQAPLPPLTMTDSEPMSFSIDLAVRGTDRLLLVPVGAASTLSLTGDWPHPGFLGTLPGQREVTKTGFTASWSLSYLARGFPQHWTEATEAQPATAPSGYDSAGYSPGYDDRNGVASAMMASSVGMTLVQPVDFYHVSERAAKFGFLFVAAMFGTVFVIELASGRRVHVVQYLLIGAALALFFCLLLALSEVIGFTPAYLLAALMTTGLIGAYLAHIAGSRRRGLIGAGVLAGLYGYLYVLLQLEDMSLLAGSLGLFAALAAFMWFTRKVDWFRLAPSAAAELTGGEAHAKPETPMPG